MTNKEFDELKQEIINEGRLLSVHELKEILKQYIHISANSKALEYIINEYFPIKIGSSKLGPDTGIYNINHGLNCYSDKTGHCNNCSICYAKRDLSTYINSCLYNLAAEINFTELSVEKIISDIEEQINSDKKEVKFLRVSESGDIKNIECLKKVIAISDYFYEKYGIITYTYTHNVELEKEANLIANSNLVLTYSYNTKLDGVKRSVVVNKRELKKYLNNPNYRICGGNCYHCSYCKDKKDLRTVVFVNHQNKSTRSILKDVLTNKELIQLEAAKFKDYSNFLLKEVE